MQLCYSAPDEGNDCGRIIATKRNVQGRTRAWPSLRAISPEVREGTGVG